MAAFLDNCKFAPTAGGTTDWTYSAPVTGYQSPAAAGVVNGTKYKYFAISADLTQWEIGEGAYNTGTGVLPRTTVLFNSLGTTAKVNFTAAPTVAIVAVKEDLISVEEANSFTATQQKQARSNIAAAWSPANWTRTVKTSASGTYTTPTGCVAINVRLVAGGGGGGGGGGAGATAGSAGGNSTFGTSFLTATAGSGGNVVGNFALAAPGTATGGDINITGGQGTSPSAQSGVNNGNGGSGGNSPFGGAGGGGNGFTNPGTAGGNAATNSGSGGGGGGGAGGGYGGSAGGYVEKLIVSPSSSYSYAVGASGGGGSAGTNGSAGGSGAAGIIIIDEYYA